jgi:ABC-type nitrate/sulfonate/bicarbonate transport system substrate-binding protein
MNKSKSRRRLELPRREFLRLGGAGALGIILAASTRGSLQAQTTPSAENAMANLKALKIGEFNPNYINQWAYRVALSLGYMQEVGIEEIETIISDEYIAGLIGGSLDLTHGDTSSFLSAADKSDQPVKIVSIFRDKEWWIMGVREGINSAEDLKGKKITGGQLDGRNTWVQRQLVAGLGLNPDTDVEWIPTSGGSDNRLQALIAGTVDAASLFPRHRSALEGAGGKFLVEQLTEAPQESFGTMGTWISENPDTLMAYTIAELRGRQWVFDPANKDQAYKIMRDLGFEIPPEFEAEYQLELDQLSPDGGFESAKVMDDFVASLALTGDVPEGLDWRQHIDLTYVWAAQEALGLPKRPASL